MAADPRDLQKTPGSPDAPEVSRSSTQESARCRSCGTMFEAGEHMEPGSIICPVCGRPEADHRNDCSLLTRDSSSISAQDTRGLSMRPRELG